MQSICKTSLKMFFFLFYVIVFTCTLNLLSCICSTSDRSGSVVSSVLCTVCVFRKLHALTRVFYGTKSINLSPASVVINLCNDVIEVFCYKIVLGRGRICTNFDDFFTFSPSPQTRGHPYKLYKPRCTHTRGSLQLFRRKSR